MERYLILQQRFRLVTARIYHAFSRCHWQLGSWS